MRERESARMGSRDSRAGEPLRRRSSYVPQQRTLALHRARDSAHFIVRTTTRLRDRERERERERDAPSSMKEKEKGQRID